VASLRNKKTETGLLLSQGLSFNAYETHITATALKLYKNKNLRCSFKAKADAVDKGKLFRSVARQRHQKGIFCDGLEMKFTSPIR